MEEKISEREYILAIRNRLFVGETLEIISPGISVRDFVMPEMLLWNKGREEGEVKQANPNSFVKIITDIPLSEMDMLRKKL